MKNLLYTILATIGGLIATLIAPTIMLGWWNTSTQSGGVNLDIFGWIIVLIGAVLFWRGVVGTRKHS